MILILGTLPPPLGGVTVHIKRLLFTLNKNNKNYIFVNLRFDGNKLLCIFNYFKNVLLSLFKNNICVVHYQLNNIIEGFFFYLISVMFGAKYIYTFHSFRVENYSFFQKLCFRLLLNRNLIFIAPSKKIKKQLLSYGVNARKIKIISTFFPPVLDEENDIIPNEISVFCTKDDYKLILGSAFKLYLDRSGEDVYGLDMCIEACKRIKNVKLLFCIPQIQDQEYLYSCEQKIKNYRLQDRVLIYKGSVSLSAIYKYADIFVRPTNTDSYGISIEEALYMGIRTVASDVCDRTTGTVLFSNRNIDDFVNKIEYELSNKQTLYVPSNYINLLKIYDRYDRT